MIATLIIIGVALAWLGYETDWLRIRLETTEYQRAVIKAQAEVKVKSSQPEDTEPLYQPSQFTPLDIPATTGDLNIVCERG